MFNGDHFTIFEKKGLEPWYTLNCYCNKYLRIWHLSPLYPGRHLLPFICSLFWWKTWTHVTWVKFKKRVKNVSSSFLMAVQAIDFSLTNIILIPIYFYEKRLQWNIILLTVELWRRRTSQKALNKKTVQRSNLNHSIKKNQFFVTECI